MDIWGMGEIRLREAPVGTGAPNRLRAHDGCSEKQGLRDPPHRELASFPQTQPGRVPGPCPRGWRSLLGSPAAPSSLLPLSWRLWLTDRSLVRAFKRRRNVCPSYPPPASTSDHVSRVLVHLRTCSAHTRPPTRTHRRTRPLAPPTWSTSHSPSHSPSLCGRWGGGKLSRLYSPPRRSHPGDESPPPQPYGVPVWLR